MRTYPTIITPFFEDGSIDYKGLGNLIHLFAKAGCDGIFAVCQSSEMHFLNDDEKLELAAFSITECRKYGLDCVVSGHTQDSLEDQISYLTRLEALKPDAIVLVTNRFASQDEPEEVAIGNLRKIMAALKPETRLGVYECPMPYKRLLTDEFIQVMIDSGRFDFIKDTCCKIDLIRHRLDLLRGSGVALYNANAKTLYESLAAGAAGYSGILLNFMPEFYASLEREMNAPKPSWSRIYDFCSFISAISVIEYQNYPNNVKYLLKKRGIIDGTFSRNGKPLLTESQIGETEDLYELIQRAHARYVEHAETNLIFNTGENFPACHASSVIALEDGTVLCAYFAGLREHCNYMGIYLSRCHNGIWEKPERVAYVGPTPHWNPVLFEASDTIKGGLWLVFKSGPHSSQWQNWAMFSYDGGKTWSDPVLYQPDATCGPVRSRPLMLKDGTLLAPNSDENPNRPEWKVRVDISHNIGIGFEKYADIPLNCTDTSKPDFLPAPGAIQPTLWQDQEGAIHALLRTNSGKIYRSDSSDLGKTWCTAYPTDLPNNNSGIDVLRVGNTLYLALNPIDKIGVRTPLAIMRSDNNGASFYLWRILEDQRIDEQSGNPAEFSYPSLFYRDGFLHCSYTYMRRNIGYTRIRIDD